MNYFNENDEYAAAWLRNLIAAGHIAPGVVDTRSIEDVRPSDLVGFTQCHFFAGTGVWSHALRLAGWGDDRPIWTGSCPCQPFSAAGKGAGFADQRHLWPHFYHLITHGKPRGVPVLGEQVASRDGLAWLDDVQADMEAAGHTVGAVDTCVAGFGAPHIRQRLYWVAYPTRQQRQGPAEGAGTGGRLAPGTSRQPGGLEHAGHHHDAGQGPASGAGQPQADRPTDQPGGSGLPLGGLGHTHSEHTGRNAGSGHRTQAISGLRQGGDMPGAPGADGGPGPTNGPWRNADWLACRDGKWRPVEPGTFPLAHGPASRVGRVRTDWHTPAGKEGQGHRAGQLKGYGNAITVAQAAAFVTACIDAAVITPLHCTP